MKYFCPVCQKEFNSYSGMWRHKQKKHVNKNILNIKDKKIKKIKIYICDSCGFEFTKKFNLLRHTNICNEKDTKNNSNSVVSNKLTDNNQSNVNKNINDSDDNEMLFNKNILIELIKNLKKFNNNQNNQNNQNIKIKIKINNEINNGNIDNSINKSIDNRQQFNFNIVALGNEKLSDVLTDKEQINILKKNYNCLEHIIKYVHFNEKYPQFHNMLINDLKSNKAFIYDDIKHDFTVIKKTDLLHNLIENRVTDIEDFYSRHSDNLQPITKNIIKKFVDNIMIEAENPKSKYLKDKQDSIEILMYNERQIVSETKKKLGK